MQHLKSLGGEWPFDVCHIPIFSENKICCSLTSYVRKIM